MVRKWAVDDRLRVAAHHHHLINEAESVYQFQGVLLSSFKARNRLLARVHTRRIIND